MSYFLSISSKLPVKTCVLEQKSLAALKSKRNHRKCFILYSEHFLGKLNLNFR